jgi:hypothetical protein
MINNLMPNWEGDMKLCPTQKYNFPIKFQPRNIMSPSGDMIFLGWTKLHVLLKEGHQMYNNTLFEEKTV